MFAPSLDLITRWHMEYGLVFERRFSPPHQPLPARVQHWVAAHVLNGQSFIARQVMNRASRCLSHAPFVDDNRVRVHIGPRQHTVAGWIGKQPARVEVRLCRRTPKPLQISGTWTPTMSVTPLLFGLSPVLLAGMLCVASDQSRCA
jgi:hypothetical protein